MLNLISLNNEIKFISGMVRVLLLICIASGKDLTDVTHAHITSLENPENIAQPPSQ